jgi:geranylgeranyl reductase
MYDIAIIGAGPAGATLSRIIGKKYRVLLVDKRPLLEPANDKTLSKCCGGLLAPDAQKMLGFLGLGLPREVLVEPQLFVVRTMDLQNHIERYYQRHYINIDREKFDRWLVSLIPKSVDIRAPIRFKYYEKEKSGYKITFHAKGKDITEHCRIIIAADGANSRVLKQTFKNKYKPRSYISIQEQLESINILPYFSAIFDAEITDFYGWIIPKQNHILVGAALSPFKHAAQRFDLFKKKLSDHGFKFRKILNTHAALLLRPVRMNQPCNGKDNVLFIGEAGAWISPSSAEGLSYAFKSAEILANILLKSPDNVLKRYNKKMQKMRLNILLKNLKSTFMYVPWLRHKVMALGLQAMNISANR